MREMRGSEIRQNCFTMYNSQSMIVSDKGKNVSSLKPFKNYRVCEQCMGPLYVNFQFLVSSCSRFSLSSSCHAVSSLSICIYKLKEIVLHTE